MKVCLKIQFTHQQGSLKTISMPMGTEICRPDLCSSWMLRGVGWQLVPDVSYWCYLQGFSKPDRLSQNAGINYKPMPCSNPKEQRPWLHHNRILRSCL